MEAQHVTTSSPQRGWSAKKWNVYKNSSGDIKVVKEGFNWFAFCFGGLWAFYKNLLVAGTIGLAVVFAVKRVPDSEALFAIFILLTLMLVYGFIGNNWVCSKLEKQGYLHVAKLEAENAASAMRTFYESTSISTQDKRR